MALYVTAVDENSPAERFGLTVGCALLAELAGVVAAIVVCYRFFG